MNRWVWSGLLSLLSWSIVAAAAVEPADSDIAPMTIEEVLALGPLPVTQHAYADAAKVDEMQRALIMQFGQAPLPRAEQSLTLFGRELDWRPITPAQAAGEGLNLWVFHLDTHRFVSGHLVADNLEGVSLFHNGQSLDLDNGRTKLALAAGTHTFWLLHSGRAADEVPGLSWQGQHEHDQVSAHVDARRRVSAQQLTNAETVGDMALSPDGRYLALSLSGRNELADIDVSRMEIHDLHAGRIVDQWTDAVPRALAWSPDSSQLAIHQGDNLWLRDLGTGQVRLLLAKQERIGSWRWHPGGQSIVFAWTKAWESDNDQRRRIRSLEDRWDGFRDNSQIYEVDTASGLIRPLTVHDQSVSLQDIHPSGTRVLLSERIIDYSEPPHSLFRLFELDLTDGEEREIGRYRQFNAALFAEQGFWLLAGPGLAIGDGDATSDEHVPNDYDTQLYRLAPDGDSARSLSRDFDPAFGSMQRLANGDLLLSAIAGERVVLVRFERDRERFVELDTGLEVMEQFVASDQSQPVVVVRGTDADAPQRVHLIDASDSHELLRDSARDQYADVVLGRVEPWTFTNADGNAIEGRYYLPPDFEPERSYPLIVYYYGGTAPVNRQFTGRYPFNLWAAKGYVVYVLQPRGTIGYGQDFSAQHVNAWGRYSADDIIEGTKKFVAAHAFVDAERIGNIGASYGGFMTMYLATLTDLYAASISHAGISALTSYWGEGWWGYGYSGIASRGSFPWNNPDLYIDQSPVYRADRITTPLLLLTGDSDTNVPPGESDNMYTALKLLGREVELIEFPGEDHWILDREKRYVWWDSMLAWFDYWLKDEPQWWHHLYPETAPADDQGAAE